MLTFLCVFFLSGICFLINENKSYYDDVVNAFNSNITYAKAKENCYLFKTSDVTNSNYTNVFFIVPNGYFVMILNKINTIIFKVQYKNIIGYVASDSIKEVSFVPSNPVLNNVTFDTLNMVGTQIRKQPTADDVSNVIVIIPAGITGISYISYVNGSVPSGGSSDVWYYAQYQPLTDPTSVYEGYVYSEKVQNLSPISDNIEGIEPDNLSNNQTSDNYEQKTMQVNTNVKIVLIILICLPVVLIFILLIVGNKRDKHNNYNEQTDKKIDDISKNQSRKARRSVDNLKGKTFKEKISSKLISQEVKTDKNMPVFPTYEVIDDDDLL